MKKFLLLLFLTCTISVVRSQSVIFYRDYNGVIGQNYFTSVFVCDTTLDGDYLVVGGTSGTIGSNYLYGVINQNGDVLWEKDSAVYDSIGLHDAYFNNGKRTLDNGFIFCGSLKDFNVSEFTGIFILKTDKFGNELWRKFIKRGSASDVYLGSDSSLFFTGDNKDSVTNISSNFLLKLSSAGDLIFMKEYSLLGSASDLLKIDNKFFISGFASHFDSLIQKTTYGWFLLSTDTNGNYLSSHTYFENLLSIWPNSFWKMNDETILMSATIYDSTFQGIIQLYKVDTSANVLWKDTLIDIPYFSSYSCELSDGNILAACGNNKVWKLNSTGDIIWASDLADTSFLGFASIEATSIFPIDNSTFLISADKSVQAPGARWPYLTKISDSTLTAINEIEESTFSIYPNPTTNNFTIKNLKTNKKSSLKIINLLGEIVYLEKYLVRDEYLIDKHFESGIYFVCFSTGEQNIVRKLIVE